MQPVHSLVQPAAAFLRPTSLVQPLFSPSVRTGDAIPELVDDQLFPAEREWIKDAVPKRRAEFGTARVCARRVLLGLGVGPTCLAPQHDRAPTWPSGIVGSISHTKGYCAVAVARTATHRSVGLDVEEERVLDSDMSNAICTPNELRAMAARGAVSRDSLLHFCAKEAFYKCQYPLARIAFDFHDVEIDLNLEAGTFRARIVRPMQVPGWVEQLRGRFVRRDGLVMCGMEVS